MIPPRTELPEDAAEWTTVTVSFPHLEHDTAESCPESLDEIMRYVRAESGDTDRADANRLRFLRTALVGKDTYWLWGYEEEDAARCFVAFRIKEDGSACLGLSQTNGFSPDQYLLADYYDEVYWP
jgi:hypothetical protein